MIVVVGVTGAGKSYFINTVAGKKVVPEGNDLASCKCAAVPVTVGRTKVLLVDTPGFDEAKRSDSEILSEIAEILSAQYAVGVELKGIIYLHRITDIRFTRGAVKTLDIFKKICGDLALKNVLLVTSRWGEVDEDLGSKRERELRENFWAYMLHKGSTLTRFHGDKPGAAALMSQLLSKDTVVLDLQRDLVDEGRNLDQTSAGQYVDDGLEKKMREYERAIADLDQMKRELMEEDRAMKRRIQQDCADEKARLQKTEGERENLRRPVGSEVQVKIKGKRSGIYKYLPFIPAVVGLMSTFVRFPGGAYDQFIAWLEGTPFDPSMLADIFLAF
ncbi:P-loop containing nucleoside triphosphate hydrolase protein [Clohesyomyces aquaticus]|uniref:p-loop containing nucleoside triphosphate hydrolase protein n=1 Tax=Clohesyomyces aquaticus TaxID=1231657 RepID=A0A1Y2AAI9_9PLEO|nr:P-loop containing nucleoside triphosphate hydrolase protein [Clohesyomyces aquaticus]